MKQEEEDRALLNSLGITSANPEDIERDILEEAITNAGGTPETEGPSSNSHNDLYNKLRAVKVEIDAVAHTVEQVKNIARTEDHVGDEESAEKVIKVEEHGDIEPSSNGLTLQEALVADRLKSLKKTKAQLEKELKKAVKHEPSEAKKRNEMLRSLVTDERKQKRKFREEPNSGKRPKKLHKTVSFDEDNDFDSVLNAASAGFVETERDELVRKGILTPFHKLKGFERRIQEPAGPSNSQNRRIPSPSSIDRVVKSMSEAAQARPTTRLLDAQSLPKLDAPTIPFQRLKTPLKVNRPNDGDGDGTKVSKKKKNRPSPGKKWQKKSDKEDRASEETDEVEASNHEEDEEVEDSESDENPYVVLEGGLKIPKNIFSKLFDYQKVGVQWLWELHCQRAGGIIGDEMGLGKTIQVLAFLGALHSSDMYKPSIIVVPVTLLRQWRREAKKWYPNFHVELLHDSAQEPTVKKKKKTESDESDYESEGSLDSEEETTKSSKKFKKWESLIKRVLRSQSGLLITTYEQLRLLGDELLDIEWGYAVLDEGHRIRNPNAEVTLACKQLQTVHRLIMTGAPIQNKLTELWSLFDFVFPGKLGVLPVFEAEFAVPISVGGYANASPLQVSTAYRCAVVLRDLIMPYLLRRMKADVNAQLTKKIEHVLFCSLTPEQRSVYRAFLASSDVEQIFDGNRNSLYGIDIMRKICNHPDLLEREHAYDNPDYGNPVRSGKMKVIEQVLKVWKDQGHRVLLFSQTQQMLDILEGFLVARGYEYRRMDGQTPVKHRMALIDEFNNSTEVFIFILTTKVGGLGTNLTGANRVIIFDPDWNPSNDMQARERAWRIGQTKDVTVYRLITRGTIEEKVYHRQIYKHFLTNKILKNPQQKRFFKSRDMKDLFTLTDDTDGGSTETSNIFGQISDDINVVGAHKDKQVPKNQDPTVATVTADNGEIRNSENLNNGLPSRKGKEIADQRDGEVDEETNILQSLFDASGIHSAVNHDAIMNAQDEDKTRLEKQANQVAQRAAEALRQSRLLRSRDSISVPTWTGKSGSAGGPSSVRRKFGSTVNPQIFTKVKVKEEPHDGQSSSKTNGIAVGASAGRALSSSELLARIRGNQERAIGDGIEQQLASNRPPRSNRNLTSVPPEILIRQICTFMQQRGMRSDSASIVQHFRDRIPSQDLPLFKSLLKQLAVLEKTPGGSFWVLKLEHQTQ